MLPASFPRLLGTLVLWMMARTVHNLSTTARGSAAVEMVIFRYSVVYNIRSVYSTVHTYLPPLSRCLILMVISVTERSGTPSRRLVPPAVRRSSTKYARSRWRRPKPRGRRSSRRSPTNNGLFDRHRALLTCFFFCLLCFGVCVRGFPSRSEVSRIRVSRKASGWCTIHSTYPPYPVPL